MPGADNVRRRLSSIFQRPTNGIALRSCSLSEFRPSAKNPGQQLPVTACPTMLASGGDIVARGKFFDDLDVRDQPGAPTMSWSSLSWSLSVYAGSACAVPVSQSALPVVKPIASCRRQDRRPRAARREDRRERHQRLVERADGAVRGGHEHGGRHQRGAEPEAAVGLVGCCRRRSSSRRRTSSSSVVVVGRRPSVDCRLRWSSAVRSWR